MVFKTDYRLMQVKSIAECSKGSILQYFRPTLSYHLSFRHLFLSILRRPFYTGFNIVDIWVPFILSYHLSLRPLFWLFLSGRLTQVLL